MIRFRVSFGRLIHLTGVIRISKHSRLSFLILHDLFEWNIFEVDFELWLLLEEASILIRQSILVILPSLFSLLYIEISLAWTLRPIFIKSFHLSVQPLHFLFAARNHLIPDVCIDIDRYAANEFLCLSESLLAFDNLMSIKFLFSFFLHHWYLRERSVTSKALSVHIHLFTKNFSDSLSVFFGDSLLKAFIDPLKLGELLI